MDVDTRDATLAEWIAATYAVSKAHGFEEQPINIDQKLLLAVGELTEALEELRAGHGPLEVYINKGSAKPEGFGIELADAVIRIFNLAEGLGIDLEQCMRLKHEYNQAREFRHGKEF